MIRRSVMVRREGRSAGEEGEKLFSPVGTHSPEPAKRGNLKFKGRISPPHLFLLNHHRQNAQSAYQACCLLRKWIGITGKVKPGYTVRF